ncbi:DUF2156 domain-containing protein [Candidatus Woesearchaeota archaeon]|nr:DUF2156 domain-containing protein [Candidatus Woesearchaeota archaeon]
MPLLPEEGEMREVTLADKGLFQKFFSGVKEPLADTTFTMRYIWAGPLKHTWTIVNGNLCVFGYDKSRYVLWGPPVGGAKLAATIMECFRIVEGMNKAAGVSAKAAAIYIPQCLKEDYEAVAAEIGATLGYWTQDYVYKTSDLVELKGKEFDSKRNKANFFMKNYSYSVEEFDFGSHFDDCMRLTELWKGQKEEADDGSWRYEIGAETEVAKTLLKFSRELGVKGIVLKVDGSVIGYSLGERLAEGMCSNIVEKTFSSVNGAAQFIFREFARQWSSYEFLNAQDDFGVDYLKRVKLSYHPARLITSYCLEKK